MTERYVGEELENFQDAVHWGAYLADELRPFVSGDVLEVGAGLGAKAEAIMTGRERSWTCVEPDRLLAARISTRALPIAPDVLVGTTADLPADARFDTALYVDVLEHIEDDKGEVDRVVRHLRPGGRLVVLCPAYQALYSPFDEAIGHYRRYRKTTLLALRPSGCAVRAAFYLDALGALLSAGNRLLLRSSTPSRSQVLFWDRRVVPISRAVVDRVFRRRVGRSVIVVWEREP